MSSGGNAIVEGGDEQIPEWIDSLLAKSFFVNCETHSYGNGNGNHPHNKYCINCDASYCKLCISPSQHDECHKILTIYRHVRSDAILINQIGDHIDCSNIQRHKCNSNWVVSLKPLPHRGSGSLLGGNRACEVCRRKLSIPNQFRFCSVSCKVQACRPRNPEIASQNDAAKHRRNRKGVPCRAPT